MLFSEVAQFFASISQISSRIEITKLLAELYQKVDAQGAYMLSYLAMGTLRAPYQGVKFNYAEKNIIKALSVLLKRDAAEIAAEIKQAGDIGAFIRSQTWHYTWQERDTALTLEQVYQALCKLEAVSGTGSQEEKTKLLLELLESVDALSASYIVTIIIGTMRLGFSDMTIIDSLSWMLTGDKSLHNQIEHGYNLCADIGLIAQKIKEAETAQLAVEMLAQIKPIIGVPIRPAAAERLPTAKDIIEKIGPCVSQPKLDGFRLQIHVNKNGKSSHTAIIDSRQNYTEQNPQLSFVNSEPGNSSLPTHEHDSKLPEIYFFSRNLQDMSYMFPDLHVQFAQFNVASLIVEGEAIVFDDETGQFLPFQETVKRKRKHNIEEVAESLPLRLFLFDILYLNGEVQLQYGHETRRAKLEKLIRDNAKTETIQAIEEQATPTVASLEAYFNKQITEGLEGLVVKRPDAIYQPGKRNFNWIKLKRHSAGHLDDTIDAVVLGYYFGRGKRTGFGIGAFLVGIYNPDRDFFETVAKVGTGLKDADWVDLKSRLDKFKVSEKPHNVDCAPELAPDVWVTPEIVVVILADEITQSPMHTAGRGSDQLGLALRFPRFMGYSIDKKATQATTTKEIRELFQMQYGRT